MNTSTNRIAYLDELRIIASLAVILIHVSSQYLFQVNIGSHEWKCFNTYLIDTSWAVPVFCMISGSLFLSRDIPIKTILAKYVLRIVIIFTIWSLFYALLFERANGINSILASFIRGYSHLWFLYLIAGLYLITPILRHIATNTTLLKYFIILGIIFTIIPDEIISAVNCFSDTAAEYLSIPFSNLGMKTVSGYALYFMIGYYIHQANNKNHTIQIITIAGILSFIISPVLFITYAQNTGEELSIIKDNFSIGNLARSIALYELSKILFSKADSLKTTSINIVSRLSNYSLGVYLIHQMIITILNHKLKINSLSFDAIISVPIIGAITCVISYVISFCISKIPVLNKTI